MNKSDAIRCRNALFASLRLNSLQARGVIIIGIALILCASFVIYVWEHLDLYNQMHKRMCFHISYKEEHYLLAIAHFFFDKIGMASFLLCYNLFAYGRYCLKKRKKIKALRRLSLLFLFWTIYSNMVLGFILPRYVFPYSGYIGKKIAHVLVKDSIGFIPTFLLIFLLIPLLSYFLWTRIKKKAKKLNKK